jgi:hypothetical protein
MVAIYRKPAAPALHLEYLTDTLSGFNVREYNYLDPTWTPPARVCEQMYPWDNYEPFECWQVFVWDDGLDYDMDGNAYFDDYPGDHCASHHRTEKGAQAEAAWLEHHGISADRISIRWGWTSEYEYDYPLRD